MDYFGLPPVDVSVMATGDTVVDQLLVLLEERLGNAPRWQGGMETGYEAPVYSANAMQQLEARDIEVALSKARTHHAITLAHVTLGWAGDAFAFEHPLDFLGHDGGGGIGAGPGLTVGAALALKDSQRVVVGVLGDGDFMQGVSALWTAAHYRIPALFIISNNCSNFNDEVHQEAVAKARNRVAGNRWIGQRIDDPAIDIVGMARAQGVEAGESVRTRDELEAEIARGIEVVKSGHPYLIDARVAVGYANPPLSRGEE